MREIKTQTTKQIMNMSLASKALMINTTLDEIKSMTPEEGLLFAQQLNETLKEVNTHGV